MAAAVFVRTAPAAVSGEKAAVRDAYMREDGLPYLTDMDSYYHVRLVDNYLNKGTLGDSVNEDGAPWDTRSFYPEGRSAAYQPGIVYLTSSLWRIFGGSLYAIEYYLAALMAALSALAAFILGCRIAGNGRRCCLWQRRRFWLGYFPELSVRNRGGPDRQCFSDNQ